MTGETEKTFESQRDRKNDRGTMRQNGRLGLGKVMHEGLGLEKGLGLGIKIVRRMRELILEGLGLEM